MKLCELEEDRVRLREKGMILYEEINKMENEVTQACGNKKLSMMGQDIDNHTTVLEEFVAVLPWLRLHLTRQSEQGSATYKEEHDSPTDMRVIEGWL